MLPVRKRDRACSNDRKLGGIGLGEVIDSKCLGSAWALDRRLFGSTSSAATQAKLTPPIDHLQSINAKLRYRRVAGDEGCAQRAGMGCNHDIKDASAATLRFGGGADQRMLFGGIVVPGVDGNAG